MEERTEERNAAVVLAAGKGSRMKTEVQKQYLLVKGKPLLYYSLKQFQDCDFIDEIVLVTGEGEEEYCRQNILIPYGLDKVTKIVTGGAERYLSVCAGLRAISDCTYVYIHDGARPFVDQSILERARREVRIHQACAVGMPVKDTIKISDRDTFAESTPDRDRVWMIQTPQVFDYQLICRAYGRIDGSREQKITDDAMVMETFGDRKVKLIPGSYRNIKITTPEDLLIAEAFCGNG